MKVDRLVLNALVNESNALPRSRKLRPATRLRRATAVREERVICRTRPHNRRNFQIFSLACAASA